MDVAVGIAGLTTALGFHRLGFKNLVLESSDRSRETGFALAIWTNAWKALDAIGVGESLRQQHDKLHGFQTASTISGLPTSEISFKAKGKIGEHDVRCVQRKVLLKALLKELPSATIRYSSKGVFIEESGYLKLVQLADGSILKTKVLVGCDGVHSIVAKWLGFEKPAFRRRYDLRGCAYFKSGHAFDPKFWQFFGKDVECGFIPSDDKTVYWFMNFTPSSQEKEIENDPAKVKQFALSNLGKVADQVQAVVESTELESILLAQLRFRHPWELLWGNISKGGCSALRRRWRFSQVF